MSRRELQVFLYRQFRSETGIGQQCFGVRLKVSKRVAFETKSERPEIKARRVAKISRKMTKT